MDGPLPRLMTPGAIRAAFVMSQVVQFLSPFAFSGFGTNRPLTPTSTPHSWIWMSLILLTLAWIIGFYALCRMNHVCTFARFQGCSPATPGNFEGVKSVKIVRWHYPSVPLQMWLQMYLSDGWSNPDLVWYHILSYACFHPLTIPWNPMNSNEIPLPGQRLALAVAPQPKPAEYRGIHLGEASDPGKE